MRKLYVVTVVARPEPDSSAFSEADGAYVNAWIDSTSREDAIKRATAEIRDAGWVVEEIEDVESVTRADYESDDPNLEYYEQALIDSEVCVFHTWPVEAQDDDAVQ